MGQGSMMDKISIKVSSSQLMKPLTISNYLMKSLTIPNLILKPNNFASHQAIANCDYLDLKYNIISKALVMYSKPFHNVVLN